MTHHDTRESYDQIARWLEENDTEVDWEALMKSDWWVGPADWVPPPKWSMPSFPRQITPQIVTNLLLAQANHGVEILGWPEMAPRGAGGVTPAAGGAAATGPSPWEKFLETLANLRIQKVAIQLITREERRQLVRMAWIEEELRKREVEWNRERVRRQDRGVARARVRRREEKRLRTAAGRGNREAIEELERRGVGSEEELGRWKAGLAMRVARCKAMRKARKKEVSIFWPGGEAMKKKKEEEIREGVVVEEGLVGKRAIELEVVRVGPNPRILTCRYHSGSGEERVCKVRVREVKKFRKGMKLEMEEPVGDNGEVWEYEGKLPRWLGRW
jgi:hypothetical protein